MNYIKFLFTLAVLLATTSVANGQSILSLSFDNHDATTHLAPMADGVHLERNSDQRSCLIIAGKVDSQSLKPIAIQPQQKYKLTLRAAIDAGDTIETNDRLNDISSVTRGSRFAGCEFYFTDENGENVSIELRGNDAFAGTKQIQVESIDVITQKMHDYVFVFQAPLTAQTLHINLLPRKRTLRVEKLLLESEDDEGTVNCNPDFRYGELNRSGWHPDTEGRLFRRPDGTVVLKCGTNATSSPFTVDDQSRYSFRCQGTGYNKTDGKVIVLFFDEHGKELSHTHLFWDRDMNEEVTKAAIKPIQGAKIAMLKASHIILEKVMVTKDAAGGQD